MLDREPRDSVCNEPLPKQSSGSRPGKKLRCEVLKATAGKPSCGAEVQLYWAKISKVKVFEITFGQG